MQEGAHDPFIFKLGCGGIFSPTPAVVSHWFKNRRGIAMGFVAAGASIGGTILPIAARYLIPQVGYVVLIVRSI
jgi:MFS family permease